MSDLGLDEEQLAILNSMFPLTGNEGTSSARDIGDGNVNVLVHPVSTHGGGHMERMTSRAGFTPWLDDSPIFLPNPMREPLPTTEKFDQFTPSGSNQNYPPITDDHRNSKGMEKVLEYGSLYAFNPVLGSSSIPDHDAVNRSPDDLTEFMLMLDAENGFCPPLSFSSENSLLPQNVHHSSLQNRDNTKSALLDLERFLMEDDPVISGVISSKQNDHPDKGPAILSGLLIKELPESSMSKRHNGTGHNGEDSTHFSMNEDDEDAESKGAKALKKRRVESQFTTEEGTGRRRSTKEIRVVKTQRDVYRVDDGFSWRKYGQKIVKGNANPRSYYKCTFKRCEAKKLVEREANDSENIVTTYEGEHTHAAPVPRNVAYGGLNTLLAYGGSNVTSSSGLRTSTNSGLYIASSGGGGSSLYQHFNAGFSAASSYVGGFSSTENAGFNATSSYCKSISTANAGFNATSSYRGSISMANAGLNTTTSSYNGSSSTTNAGLSNYPAHGRSNIAPNAGLRQNVSLNTTTSNGTSQNHVGRGWWNYRANFVPNASGRVSGGSSMHQQSTSNRPPPQGPQM